MTITIKEQSWYEIIAAGAEALGRQHAAELNLRGQFHLNHEMMLRAEAANITLFLGAYDDRRLIGYVAWMLSPSLFTDALCATQSAWFVEKQWRKGGAGVKLMEESFWRLRTRGVKQLFAHFWLKDDVNDAALSRFFTMLGGKERERVYEFWLDDLRAA